MTDTSTQTKRTERYDTGITLKPPTQGRKHLFYADLVDATISKQFPDPFKKDYSYVSDIPILKPPVNPVVLAKIVTDSAFLEPNIECMVKNVHGFGYHLEFNGDPDNEGSDYQSIPEAQAERKALEQLFDQANPFETFQSVRDKIGKDYETFANAFMEVTRDNKNRVFFMSHLPAVTMRITVADKNPTTVNVKVKRDGREFTTRVQRNFRRFVQIASDNVTKVYFKEFGDPRVIDPKTGLENTALAADQGANEVIHFSRYNPTSVYGLPRWYCQMPSITGARESELVNLDFFENNAIPAMAVLVSGGHLTSETIDMINYHFNELKGRASMNKVIVMEARGAPEDAGDSGSVPVPKVELKPLQEERQSDATFLNYQQRCQDQIRSSFRIAPVLVGHGETYTFASAMAALEVCESQVFSTERNAFDSIMNDLILGSWGIKYWTFKSNSATISSSEDVINAIEAFNTAGAITPNTAIQLLNSKMNTDIPLIENYWGDIPFALMNSIMRAQGGEDKTNFVRNALRILDVEDIEDIPEFTNQTVGNSDEIFDPENDPEDQNELERRNNRPASNDQA